MDVKSANKRLNELSHFTGTPRKRWEASKKFAAECGINTKQFNKGLGPAWDSVAKLAQGAGETKQYVPLDERSFVQLRKEIARLGKIVDGYMTIVKANTPKSTNDPTWYPWKALQYALQNYQQRSERLIKAADEELKKNKRR
jgi:hypothetical protein